MVVAVALCFIGGLLIGAGAAGGGVRFLSERDEGGRLRGEGKIYEEDETVVPAFDKIFIDIEHSDLEILPSRDRQFRISYRVYGNKDQNPISWTSQGGTFTLKENAPNIHVNFSIRDLFFFSGGSEYVKTNQKEGITLYVPAGTVIKNTEIKSQAGDALVKGLTGTDFSAEILAGDFSMDQVQCDRAAITMKSGDLKGKNLFLKQSMIDSKYGDIHFDDSSISDMNTTMESGDLEMKKCTFAGKNNYSLSYGDALIEFTTPGSEEINWSLQTKVGEINLPGNLIQKGTSLNRDGDELTGYSLNQDPKQPSVNIDCKDGDITVR